MSEIRPNRAQALPAKMGEIEIVLMRFPIKNESQTNLFIYVFSCELVPAITRHSIISYYSSLRINSWLFYNNEEHLRGEPM